MNIKEYPTSQIRNIAIAGHNGTGKTSLAEAMLFLAGATNRLGRVEDGTTVCDYDPDEIKRKNTINATLASLEWKKCKINLLDTPGFADFIGDVKGSLRVVDGVIVVLNAPSGVETETEKVWNYADEYNTPRCIFVNKMEKERADYEACIASVEKAFKVRAVPIELPIGKEANFKGVVNILDKKAYTVENGKLKEFEIPAEMKNDVAMAWDKLVEAVSETSDELISKFLDGQELTRDEVIKGVHDGILKNVFVPVFCGSATHMIGIHGLLDTLVDDWPNPTEMPPVKGTNAQGEEVEVICDPHGPLCAFVFKTIADPFAGRLSLMRIYSGTLNKDYVALNVNKEKEEKIASLIFRCGKEQQTVTKVVAGDIVASAKLAVTTTSDCLCDKAKPIKLPATQYPEPQMTLALEAKNKGDEDKIATAIHRLIEEDPTISTRRDAEMNQFLVSGMGEMHLNVMLEKAKSKFGVEAVLKEPRISYRETIKAKADNVQGKFKRQSGGRGQYGDCVIRMEPLPRGSGFEFINDIHGGVIPTNYIPAVEKGIREAKEHGILAGYPVVDFKVVLFYGSYHEVDSSDMAFKIAGSMAFKKAMELCKPTILEPIMNIEVRVPEEFMGAIIGDLNSRRGQVMGMDSEGGWSIVKAQVPQSEIAKYSVDLRSIARGRGSFIQRFSHYAECPPDVQKKVIESSDRKQATEEEA